MDVACSTLCFTREPLARALRHIAELDFTKVDLAIADEHAHIGPDQIVDDAAGVIQQIRQGPTLGFSAITLRTDARDPAFPQRLDAVAHFAKQLAAPYIVLDAAPSGTPIENEIKRLSELDRIVSAHGTILTIVTKTGTITEYPDATLELCKAIPTIGVTLDPSHFVAGPHQGKSFDQLFPYVRHVHLRDSGRRMDQLQVRIGRGEIEYGRIVTSLTRYQFIGSLAVEIEDFVANDFDVEAETRKLGLLLESLL